MNVIHKQLVTDEHGQPVGVLIPYQEWLKIERELMGSAVPNEGRGIARYAGVIHLTEEPVAYQRRLRDEWA
jgi:hypothetical protein